MCMMSQISHLLNIKEYKDAKNFRFIVFNIPFTNFNFELYRYHIFNLISKCTGWDQLVYLT